jgi:hypothetical protein
VKRRLRLIELKPRKLRGWRGLMGRAPNRRKQRSRLPEPTHTYKTVMYGQEVTVQVLPSAGEASPEDWERFTAMPKDGWVRTDNHIEEISFYIPRRRWDAMDERCLEDEMEKPWRRKK